MAKYEGIFMFNAFKISNTPILDLKIQSLKVGRKGLQG